MFETCREEGRSGEGRGEEGPKGMNGGRAGKVEDGLVERPF